MLACFKASLEPEEKLGHQEKLASFLPPINHPLSFFMSRAAGAGEAQSINQPQSTRANATTNAPAAKSKSKPPPWTQIQTQTQTKKEKKKEKQPQQQEKRTPPNDAATLAALPQLPRIAPLPRPPSHLPHAPLQTLANMPRLYPPSQITNNNNKTPLSSPSHPVAVKKERKSLNLLPSSAS